MIYSFDFFETIVGINFPQSGGYVLMRVDAHTNTVGTPRPPNPSVSLVLPTGAKLIQKLEPVTAVFTPAHTTTTRIYFVWSSLVPLPTLADYDNIVVSSIFPPATYAQQFARSVGSPTGFKDPQAFGVEVPPEGGSGYFSTAAIADGYAASWNSHISGSEFDGAYLSDGTVLDGGKAAPVFVTFIDVPVTTPATWTLTLHGQYLLSLPKTPPLSSFTATVTAQTGDSHVTLTGYHGKVPASIAAITAPEDMSAEASIGQNGAVQYTMTSQIIDKLNHVTVAITGGGAG